MSHYTLGWHDQQQNHYEISEYANDAFEAVKHAREDVPYLQEHPFLWIQSRRSNEKIYQSNHQQLSLESFAVHFLHQLITLGYEKI